MSGKGERTRSVGGRGTLREDVTLSDPPVSLYTLSALNIPLRPHADLPFTFAVVLDEAGGKHARGKRYTAEQWDAGQDAFVNDVVRGGLVRREKDWFGACEGEGEEMCRVALKELLVMD